MGGKSGKLGVVVLKASMPDWEGRSASTHVKFGVVVLKACMLDWGVDLQVWCSSIEAICQ